MVSTVYIAKNVYGGAGMGKLGDGRVVFVPGAWAGENVRAQIVAEKSNYVRADLVEVVEPSPERIDGREFAGIPGCVYADLSCKGEYEAKESQLRELFERARFEFDGIVSPPVDESGMRNYRNKAIYHFARRLDGWVIGYLREPMHEVVDVEYDPMVVPAINAKLPEIRRSVVQLLSSGPVSVRRDFERCGKVTVRWSEKTGVKWWIGSGPENVVFKETTCGKVFEVPAGGFYQVNPVVGDQLVSAVVSEYSKIRHKCPNLADLYCGVGVFGLCCGSEKLIGIECATKAVEFARRNASGFKGESMFFAGQVKDKLSKIKSLEDAAVVVDPPREGMEKGVARRLAASGAAKIFYVSCDPATMTRDLRVLCEGYRIESVRWFNMFPRTARFETLVVLDRRQENLERK